MTDNSGIQRNDIKESSSDSYINTKEISPKQTSHNSKHKYIGMDAAAYLCSRIAEFFKSILKANYLGLQFVVLSPK